MENEPSWLSRRTDDTELDTGFLANVLHEYRRSYGLNQADLAEMLSLDQSYVSKIETGQRQVRDMRTMLHIAERLGIPPAQMGLSNAALSPVSPPSRSGPVDPTDPARRSQHTWRRVRRHLNHNRRSFATLSGALYRAAFPTGNSTFLTRAEWMPSEPLPLDSIRLAWDPVPGRSTPITGTEPEAHHTLPLRAPGRRFDRYTSAVRYLDRPALFENRPSYRLWDVDLSSGQPRMSFRPGTYFAKLDVSEAVAHECAAAHLSGAGSRADWSELPFRELIGDPFDLRRRAVLPAVETLTLRRRRDTGDASFLLHWRDPAKVATAAGVYGLIPAGEFQPSSIAAGEATRDLDLWRGMVREFSEELLGEPEHDGSSGTPLNYDDWPLYQDLRRARTEGRITTHCLGIGLDTLTLAATILTVVVFDDDVFDALFGHSMRINAEGVLVTAAESSTVSEGVPFTEASVRRLVDETPMASPGACLLSRAWNARDSILSRRSR
ncbi:helix-turn-helix domain-containing protein [Saccharomonospora halophila]|uniref:helix-turn-helix domain-containing protein n=1 Tax=Saccharomonospora halophila TaxID=129922 RepID=UPI00035C5E3D|nr:helix-turn-helix transcriptional regulator [Saccharomonospora halophila]